MEVGIIRDVLAWCSVMNVGLLLFWWLWFMLAHDFIYRIHRKWFKLSEEKFDAEGYFHHFGIPARHEQCDP